MAEGAPPRRAIVSTALRPDLAETTGRWRWAEFFARNGVDRDTVLGRERAAARSEGPLPRVLVGLCGDEPVGMATLAAQDLDTRPDLTPWLAGVYVLPGHRRRGHARRLVAAIEDLAREAGFPTLWLYTRSAEPLYRACGWRAAETVARQGRDYLLMRRDLAGARGRGPVR